MARITIKASPDGLQKATSALYRFSSKQALADFAGVSRTTVHTFFTGGKISAESFRQICKVLELNWEEVAGIEKKKPLSEVPPPTPPLVEPDNRWQRGMWIPNLRCRRVWGRDSFIEKVLYHLNDPQSEVPIFSLCGSAGYGKTEVARTVAMAALEKNLFADVLWVKARDTEFVDGEISPSQRDESLGWNQLLQEIAHQLDGCSLGRVRQRLKEEKRLIVLDNAETAQLGDILPKLNELLNPSRVLLTSRLQADFPFVKLINIHPLEEEYSYQLLQYEAECKEVPALLEATRDQLQQIYTLSCGAPLALHFIVGRVLDDRTLDPVLSALEQVSGDVEKIYEFSLKTAWERISQETKQVLHYMGNADAGVTAKELSSTGQVKESEWSIVRRELRRWYLVEEGIDAKGEGRYNLHPWLRRSLRGGIVEKWKPTLQELQRITESKYGIT